MIYSCEKTNYSFCSVDCLYSYLTTIWSVIIPGQKRWYNVILVTLKAVFIIPWYSGRQPKRYHIGVYGHKVLYLLVVNTVLLTRRLLLGYILSKYGLYLKYTGDMTWIKGSYQTVIFPFNLDVQTDIIQVTRQWTYTWFIY